MLALIYKSPPPPPLSWPCDFTFIEEPRLSATSMGPEGLSFSGENSHPYTGQTLSEEMEDVAETSSAHAGQRGWL